jgi:phosphatidylglycerophosphatase A
VRRIAVVVATVAGVGRFPVAPGTAGSLVAVPLLPSLAGLRTGSPLGYVLAVTAVVAAGIWSAGVAEDVLGRHDHSRIVIDEVSGMVIAGAFLPGTWGAAGLAFVLFRILDVLKPFPAGLIDDRLHGGLGVVGDDLVAGVYAGLLGRLVLALV